MLRNIPNRFNLSTMKKFLPLLFLLVSTGLQAQVLRNLNFRYLYNPDEVFTLSWDVVKQSDTYTVFYDLKLNDTSRLYTDLKITWELRKSPAEKTGIPKTGTPTELESSAVRKAGSLQFSADADQTIVVAKVNVVDGKKSWAFLFYKPLPETQSLYATSSTNDMIKESFIKRGSPVSFHGFTSDKPLQVSYYKDAFPAGAPAFSTAQARVAKTIKPDSIFSIDVAAEALLPHTGLYLIQQDTASTAGIAFRVEEDYPKLGKLESLAGPLIYVCTKQEYEKIKLAGNDKKRFDQVILSITGNTERARTFMRNYFKRVEAANLYFSSYKEGWKTDRGMIYIIYGVPDEVYLFDDREVWEYKNENFKERFQFVKSATIFDPDNFVLIRQKSFADDWYQMIDLWRKARF